jgi:hypothetical protein
VQGCIAINSEGSTSLIPKHSLFAILSHFHPGPYYHLGTIGPVPRAYDIFRPTKELKEEKIKTKKKEKKEN